MSYAIVVNGLSKKFRRYHPDRPLTLQEAILGGLGRIKPVEYLWALRDISFKIESGRTVGVFGPNGAGKSTLLRLISGVGKPDAGSVVVRGRIGALLDLGAGFHPDLTGRENVFVVGVISGLTRSEVSERFDSIVAFAELEEFIDSPVRTYSTGMLMRLAFSVAVHVEPEILLIDEVLAVGDIMFQRKCLEQITKFKAKGCTIILVTHDTAQIRNLCDEAIWLHRGRVVARGPTNAVVDQYIAEGLAETKRRTPAEWPVVQTDAGTELRINENRFGSLELEITAVKLLNGKGLPTNELKSGDQLCVVIAYNASQPIPGPIFFININREDGLLCYDTTTSGAGLNLPTIQGNGQVKLYIERLDLTRGLYYVNVGVCERDWAYSYDYHQRVYPLVISSDGGEKGIIHPPHRWEIEGEQKLQTTVPIRKAP